MNMKDRMEELYKPNELTDDLKTNEDEINKVKKSEETAWDYIFGDSEDDEATDEKTRYRMREKDTPATYETEVDYYDPTTIQIETEIRGQKIWLKDIPEKRPKLITVYLLANGEKVKEQVVSDRTNWIYRFTNIPVYDTQGEKIKYSVEEKSIADYTTTYNKFDIINERLEYTEETDKSKREESLAPGRATRIGLFVLGAAAITAGLLLDQVRKEK